MLSLIRYHNTRSQAPAWERIGLEALLQNFQNGKSWQKENWNKFLKEIYEIFEGRFFTYQDFKDVLQNYCPDKDFVKKIDVWMNSIGQLENY